MAIPQEVTGIPKSNVEKVRATKYGDYTKIAICIKENHGVESRIQDMFGIWAQSLKTTILSFQSSTYKVRGNVHVLLLLLIIIIIKDLQQAWSSQDSRLEVDLASNFLMQNISWKILTFCVPILPQKAAVWGLASTVCPNPQFRSTKNGRCKYPVLTNSNV